MPITLATLFTTPQDVWDLLSVEGVDLRQDDHNLASGKIIQTTADVALLATTISVVATPVALLAGVQLTFDGGTSTVPSTVTLTSAAAAGSTSLSVSPVAAVIASGAMARDSGVNAATGARLLVGARKGTSRVKLYCNSRYDDSELRLAGSVLDWATIIAAKFLCERRAQACPKSLMASYEETMEELRMVQAGQLAIEDIGTRGVDWPTVTNISVDPTYNVMRARVQPNISEGTPTGYNQYIDWNSAAAFEF